MLRRTPERGGFWQCVTGAPVHGETTFDAAVREVREETGFDVCETLLSLGVGYAYRLAPDRADHWERIYGPGVSQIHVTAWAAEVHGEVPVLDPTEHDDFRWCTYREAEEMLDWPIENDALAGRRAALAELQGRLASAGR